MIEDDRLVVEVEHVGIRWDRPPQQLNNARASAAAPNYEHIATATSASASNHRRDPRTWTPELAVFELIDDLRDKTSALYDLPLQELFREQCTGRREDGDDETLDHRPT
jgi:hypothetical protein